MHLLRTAPLIDKLATGSLSSEQRAAYLMASFLVFTCAYYTGWVASGAPPWSIPSVAEALAIALITIVGVVKTFDAAGGDSNKNYIVDFTCLYVPVSVTTLLVVWGAYWTLAVVFRESLIALSQSHMQFVINLSRLGSDIFGFLTFLSATGVQAVIFYRLTHLLRAVHRARLVAQGAATDLEKPVAAT
jgi:hypothetical protein